jgi:phosphotriesterase-related protein
MADSVQTVLGPVSRSDLGIILPHEHLFSDDRSWSTVDPSSPLRDHPITLETLGRISRNPTGVTEENLHIDDEDEIAEEASRFRTAGGTTLVDQTCSPAIGARPEALPRLAQRTGLKIVAGCGYYIDSTIPPHIRDAGVDEIALDLRRQVLDGLGGSGVRPGIIGEIGTGSPITPAEQKVLRACARVQQETGLGLAIHVHPWRREAMDAIRIVSDEGADLSRVSIDHLDNTLDLEYHLEIAATGVFLGFMSFGTEYYWDEGHYYAPTDRERVQHIVELVRRGHLRQILISQDIGYKSLLVRYGGWGYAHVLEHVVPMLLRWGLSQQDVDVITRENPARLLCGEP